MACFWHQEWLQPLQKGRWGKKIWWLRLNGQFGARREMNVS
jgi:hypothetical protein